MKKILISLFVIGVVSVASIGATRAYFTDQETAPSTLAAARLDVELRGDNSDGIVIPLGDEQTFQGGLVPGVWTDRYEIAIYNKGWGESTVPVKYRWTSVFTGEERSVFDMLQVKVEEGNCDWLETNPGGLSVRYNGSLRNLNSTSGSSLNPNITRCSWFSFKLDPAAGNELQGEEAPFDLILDATQTNNPGWSE